ncbi:MAG: preprotein translocase subunit SecA [Planctomycetia bacterium]|nr:preprotein translocase subunit SecA [Planctomycetia bacterium]
MVTQFLNKSMTKIFGSRNGRLIKSYRHRVEAINVLEAGMRVLTDAQLRAKAEELRRRMADGESDMAILPEAFALMRESMDRNIGLRNAFNPAIPFDSSKLSTEAQAGYQQVKVKCVGEHDWRFVEIPPELYQAIRDAVPDARPPYRARPFDVQLIGGMVLYDGKIAEMATGEGKTFVAPLACFLMGLAGKHCHVVTVNDYLVRRDAAWVAPAFYALGMSVGFIQVNMDNEPRQKAYQCTVTYGTNSEFGFDYLRDNMKQSLAEQVQGPLDFAIVDEVDSVLIDEARTPLIISGPAHDDSPRYRQADEVIRKVIAAQRPWDAANNNVETLKRKIKGAEGEIKNARGDAEKITALQNLIVDTEKQLVAAEAALAKEVQLYEVELDRKSAHLTHEGIRKAQEFAGVGSFYVGGNMDWPHLLEQALRAHVVYEIDKDYVVQKGEVIIVDESTGRLMVGRQWSDGLHQAVEAKERVTVKPETQTMATITLQNFFKLYKRLAGMTGTAMTESEEFSKIYNLEVVTIPTNRPLCRQDFEDLIFMNENAKWNAIVEQIKEVSDRGQPVLVGTTSVEKSQRLSQILAQQHGIEHEVLNAKNHEREAEIIAKAGTQNINKQGRKVGRVTIATNMAGRGTDISLGSGVLEVGGLFVLGTERHESRRIDNQLRGRSGRQGDPGMSRFFLSLEDDLMRLFAGDFMLKALQRLGMKEDEAIEHGMVSRAVARAQKKVEERNFGIRKNLLEYDEVRNYQRNFFYTSRQAILEGRNLREIIFETIGESVRDAVGHYLDRDYVPTCVAEWVRVSFNTVIDPQELRDTELPVLEMTIKDKAREDARSNIRSAIAEFMDPDAHPEDYDYAGMAAWALSQFQVQISAGQLRTMQREEIIETMVEKALDLIDHRDCNPLAKYLVKGYAQQQLAQWANDKFELTIPATDLTGKTQDQAVELILDNARRAYQQREISYPVDYALEATLGAGGLENVYASEQLAVWVKAKFGTAISGEEIRSLGVEKLRQRLLDISRRTHETIDQQIDEALAKLTESRMLAAWVADRFVTQAAPDEFEGEPPEERRERIGELAHAFLRRELTELERTVLLQIYDVTWKDHLYAMDQLRDTIGLRGIAQRDPVIEYKREGSRLFDDFLKNLREKVTDVIFRMRVASAGDMRNVYAGQEELFDANESYGVGDSAAARELQAAPAAPAAEAAEAEETPLDPIVNAGPKIGRNDPCPCGSGKKYKHCCGRSA